MKRRTMSVTIDDDNDGYQPSKNSQEMAVEQVDQQASVEDSFGEELYTWQVDCSQSHHWKKPVVVLFKEDLGREEDDRNLSEWTDINHPPQSQIDHQEGIQIIMRKKKNKKRESTGEIMMV